MQIRVLGCSGSIAAGSRTTAFLVDDEVLIDAGTGVGDLTLDEMVRIDHIFVTHSHLDHVLAIGLLADSVTRARRAQRRAPIQVHALPETLAALRSHVLNGVIWPDFTRLPEPSWPVLALVPLALGDVVRAGGATIEALPAAHTVPALGYAVSPSDRPEAGAWVFTGDTGPVPALWQRLATMKVHSLVIETAFRDDEHLLADISRHLCPTRLRGELAQLRVPTEVFITHIKPGELDAVMSAIAAQPSPHRVHALVTGQRIVV
ncbi:MAG: 3',5'-cyclic-nucleotide phosphodiesterase [Rubrivivax sp. SCN 71-131]|jgi:ribonuclease BN (tRNA processing enzyme)|nr:MAG: 3',5'-cyclic-nucleotide phosphodiesterase [Rubrivivax sp. SCN 71-131]